jgi:hypothetical protein
MKIDHFDPPANNDDFGGDQALKDAWSEAMSHNFDLAVSSVTAFLDAHGGGTCQFYNPVTQGRTEPDLAASLGDIPWNGFPKRFLSTGPGVPTRFADAEPALTPGQNRPQDEYLEWHVSRDGAGKIVSVEFTCEGYDYYEFLATNAPDTLLSLYQQFISPDVKKSDLFNGDTYDRLNRWNTRDGAMHLTHPANNLFAEVFLAGSATVRRKSPAGAEITAAIPLIKCALFGSSTRNSDPAIGAGVNGLARQGRMITLANPVGLYIDHIDEADFHLADGSPATGFFQIVRGVPGRTLRAVFAAPPALAATGITVSDVLLGTDTIQFGGEIAQKITMKLTGVASQTQGTHDAPVACGAIPQVEESGVAGVFDLAAPTPAAVGFPMRSTE